MLKKRLIGVVTVRNGWAVQSFGYRRYLPLGKPECLVDNLDRWGADEILVQVVDASGLNRGPDFDLLERLGRLGLETPLIYAGGIRSLADGVKLVQLGADRLVVDALLHDSPSMVRDLSEQLGAQAIIASMPLTLQQGGVAWFDYRKKISKPIDSGTAELLRTGVCSEVIVTDWQNEGVTNGFDQKLIDEFTFKNMPMIAFGGISESQQMRSMLGRQEVVAVAVGNFLNYREHSIQNFKASLTGVALRAPYYQSVFPDEVDVHA
jgi:cyclase